jgi:L-arabinose transport system ATP-binding protein
MSGYLEFNGISKAYPGVQALADISFRAEGGRVLALLGENGAGESTLLKILSGNVQPDSGKIIIDGQQQHFSTSHQSIKSGVSVIYQEQQLIPQMSVMENVFLQDIPTNKLGFVNFSELRRMTQEMIDRFELPFSPTTLVGRLPAAYQQMVEVMKAYRRDSKIIAFDEPTASLTDKEIEVLFQIITQLRKEGKIIIYVSHRLAEIFRITDEIVVLKDGRLVKTLTTRDSNESELIKAMVGRDIGDTYSNLRRNDKKGDVLLEVRNLVTDKVKNVSFELRRGEVLGFAGLIGSGRTEVVRAIFGADKIISGEILLEGKPVSVKEPKDAIDAGIALCPEDRKEDGLVLFRSIRENTTMPILKKMQKWLMLSRRKEEAVTQKVIKKYTIRTPSSDKEVIDLSGGNQQKVILGRWTTEEIGTKLLILDEPTKGIDVGTKAEVYQIVCDFAKMDIGVIFISSELTEVINVADRIIVMHEGRMTGQVLREEATEENVLALAMQ